jgi:hypothetical protein
MIAVGEEYTANDFARAWVRKYDRPATSCGPSVFDGDDGGNDIAWAVAVDAGGYVYAAGEEYAVGQFAGGVAAQVRALSVTRSTSLTRVDEVGEPGREASWVNRRRRWWVSSPVRSGRQAAWEAGVRRGGRRRCWCRAR